MKSQETIEKEIEAGYINESGEPLKCHHCESKNLDDAGHAVEELGTHCVTEYKKVCLDCQKEVGYWSYGRWEI